MEHKEEHTEHKEEKGHEEHKASSPPHASGSKKFIKVIVGICFLFIAAIVGVLGGGIYYLSKDLPSVENLAADLQHYEPNQSTRVYADDGSVIGQFYMEKRVFVPLSEMSKDLFQAILAVEDARFYDHHGVDLYRVVQAFIKNLQGLKVKQGASTITQQLARALFLTPEKTFSRKIKEILLARKMEAVLTKDQILELYLNQIYFGEGAYGVQVASKTYFGKDVGELDIEEAALLAGLPKAPNYYSPYRSPKRARKRQQIVLKRMRQEGYITEAQYQKARKGGLVFKEKSLDENLAPYFNESIRQYLMKQYGSDLLYRGGLNIYTPLNIKMQEIAEAALEKGLLELEERQGHEGEPHVEGAILVLDPTTGGIKAMVGGRDFNQSEFNRTLQSRRQPGSAFKPIIFGAAVKGGFSPSSIVVDNPVVFEDHAAGTTWKPRNYGEKFYGPISLREALTHSRNLATIDLLQKVGIGPVVQLAKKLGMSSPLEHNLSLALGSSGVSLMELTSAYSVYANRGIRMRPMFFVSVEDHTGHVLEQTDMHSEAVLFEETAYLVTNMLEDVIRRGTGRKANVIDRPVAGKTGTTNDFVDAWFIGYTPNLVAGVWVGFDDQRSLGDQESGGKAALPIWLDFMQAVLPQLEPQPFVVPENVVYAKINPTTGLLVSDPERGRMEVFVKGKEPKEYEVDRPKTVDFFEMDDAKESL